MRKTTLRRMRTLALLHFLLFSSYSLHAQQVNLSYKDTPLKTVLNQITEQASYNFVYTNDLNINELKVSIDCQNCSINQVFEKLFTPNGLSFKVVDKQVILSQAKQSAEPVQNGQEKKVTVKGTVSDDEGAPIPGLYLFLKNNSSIGAITDVKGNFSVQVPESLVNKDAFVVSFIGMKSVEVLFDGKASYTIVLEPESTTLSDAVVTGYQTINRKLFTGTAARVSMENVKLASEPDVSKSLEGHIAGVSLKNVSSTFGTAPIIRVRGASSITGNQKPLWVVDGVVLEDAVEISMDELNSGDLSTLISSGVAGLNMDDIESIQVLKDVSATALYGARAMNGVIVITTKKGKQGLLRVNYSFYSTIKPKPSYSDYNILNSQEQMSVSKELYQKGWINVAKTQYASNHGIYGKMFDLVARGDLMWSDPDAIQLNKFLSRYETVNTDWFDELFKVGLQQQHSLNISGGGETSQFYASVGYLKDGGWTIADKVDRYTSLLKGTFNLSKKFTVSAQSNMSYRKQQLSGVSNSDNDTNGVDRWTGRITRQFDNNPFMYALSTSRAISARDENGNLEFFRRNFANYNILDELSKNKTELDVKDMTFQTELGYKIHPELSVSGRFSARYFDAHTSRIINENSNEANAYRAGTRPNDSENVQQANPLLYEKPGSSTGIKYSTLPEGGIFDVTTNTMTNYYFNGNINWNPIYKTDHRFTFLLGSEVRFINRYSRWNSGFGHFFDGGNVSKPSPNYIEKLAMDGKSYFERQYMYERSSAFYLNYGYSYLGRYTINGTVRYDGSNRLGKSTTARWLPTWNIGGKWLAKDEDFLKSVDLISTLSIRTTYGLNASMGNVSNSTLIALAQASSRPIAPDASELEIYLKSLENQDLTWEKQYELNMGLDFGILRDRLLLTFDFYNRKGFDMISQYQSSGVGGESLKYGNVANIDSYGFELDIAATPVKTENFTWNVNFNYAYNHSKVKDLKSDTWVGRAASTYGVPVEGGPVRGIYSARFAGLDSKGVPTFYDRNNNIVRYLNVQTSDFSDFEYSGNLEPTTNIGFNNSATWKGLTLSVLITGQFGHVKRVMQDFNYYYNDSQALSAHIKNRWRVAGDEKITNIPAIQSTNEMEKGDDITAIRTAYRLYGMSDYWIADAAFLRLKNVGISYSLPSKLASRIGAANVNIGFQAANLWLLWTADPDKLGGEDPEFNWTGGTSMPITRQYTLSLNLTF